MTASLSGTVVTSHMCRHILLQMQDKLPLPKSFTIVLAVLLTSRLLRAKGSTASSQSSVESHLIKHRDLQMSLGAALLQGVERREHAHSTINLKANTQKQQKNRIQNALAM